MWTCTHYYSLLLTNTRSPLPNTQVISQFRSEKEVEFNTALLSVGGSDSQSSSALKQDTEREMHLQKSQFEQNSGKALQVLLAKCCEVDLEVPAARIRSAQKAAMM